MKSQNKWVISRLERYGKVTRNQALRNNITRLASRILDVRPVFEDKGMEIVASRDGKDYVYNVKAV